MTSFTLLAIWKWKMWKHPVLYISIMSEKLSLTLNLFPGELRLTPFITFTIWSLRKRTQFGCPVECIMYKGENTYETI